jgi:hypothetical protein
MGRSVLDLPMPRVSPDLGALLRSIATRTPQLSCARAHFARRTAHTHGLQLPDSLMLNCKSTATPPHEVIARALQSVRLNRLKILFIPEPGLAQHGGG